MAPSTATVLKLTVFYVTKLSKLVWDWAFILLSIDRYLELDGLQFTAVKGLKLDSYNFFNNSLQNGIYNAWSLSASDFFSPACQFGVLEHFELPLLGKKPQ
jgi:hypothetical protein